eukprot:42249-Chlamydomonas_euryale.AAC.1
MRRTNKGPREGCWLHPSLALGSRGPCPHLGVMLINADQISFPIPDASLPLEGCSAKLPTHNPDSRAPRRPPPPTKNSTAAQRSCPHLNFFFLRYISICCPSVSTSLSSVGAPGGSDRPSSRLMRSEIHTSKRTSTPTSFDAIGRLSQSPR